MKQNDTLNQSSNIGVLLEDIVDKMIEGFQIISPEWRYLYVNEIVAKQGKATKENLIGRTMMECYPGIETTPLFKKLKICIEEQKSMNLDNEFTFPDGSSGWFQLCIHPIKSGLLILSVDITERKSAETELKAKIREVDILMNSTTDRELRNMELKKQIANLKILAEKVPT